MILTRFVSLIFDFGRESTKILPKTRIFAALIRKTMAEFKIGDKVNFLSTVGGGKVTKIIIIVLWRLIQYLVSDSAKKQH